MGEWNGMQVPPIYLRSLLSTATPKLFTEPPSPAQQEDPLVVQELHRQGYTKFLCL